ncbi:hypothetical protein AWB68_00929 [Caballeronia choica]|uniref:Uncharacterized protein n=1 Tax=Caballeronia choica TaxID=326476 RepID=A0A158FT34_9BURK|nr:hypothetical protein AWB68_00929 [Caballeronia choica]
MQWAVGSQSDKQLAIGLFKAYGSEPSLSKSDAIVRVQHDMLSGKMRRVKCGHCAVLNGQLRALAISGSWG